MLQLGSDRAEWLRLQGERQATAQAFGRRSVAQDQLADRPMAARVVVLEDHRDGGV